MHGSSQYHMMTWIQLIYIFCPPYIPCHSRPCYRYTQWSRHVMLSHLPGYEMVLIIAVQPRPGIGEQTQTPCHDNSWMISDHGVNIAGGGVLQLRGHRGGGHHQELQPPDCYADWRPGRAHNSQGGLSAGSHQPVHHRGKSKLDSSSHLRLPQPRTY